LGGRVPRRGAALLAAVALAGCAAPHERFDAEARRLGLERRLVAGAPYRHVAYLRPGPRRGVPRLHVYLGSDGTPWERGVRVAADPTPRDPLALALLARDPAPAVYLGRPCYHGLAAQAPCRPGDWTHGRYAPRIVNSMAAALRQLAPRGRPLVLLGYSGGGVLSMLIAARVPEVVAVVTVAANLDVAEWTRLHGDEPLAGSLDPARAPPLPARIVQIHFVGERDARVPPHLAETVARRQPRATVRRWPGFDHRCCWVSAWPEILAEVERRLAGAAHGARRAAPARTLRTPSVTPP